MFLSVAALYCLMSVYAHAQSAERIINEAAGYSFTGLKGWSVRASAEGYGMVNPEKTVVLAVKSHSYKDFASFLADANIERDGLEVVGKAQDIAGGKTFRTVKRSPQGIVVFDTAVLFSSLGGGVVVIAITNEPNANAGFEAALVIANSVKFEAPKQSDVAAKVKSLLSGKLLTYLYTGNGYSERKDILLCTSGTFYQSTDMGGFSTGDVDGPSFAALGAKSGTWSISSDGGRLVLRFQNAGITEYKLSARQASNEIGMNNQRFFVQAQNKCR